jgi:hypothetical protein
MTDQHIINRYAKYSIDELNDMLDKAKQKIADANAVYMRHRLASDKDAMETASIRFYNLQMVLRHRGSNE